MRPVGLAKRAPLCPCFCLRVVAVARPVGANKLTARPASQRGNNNGLISSPQVRTAARASGFARIHARHPPGRAIVRGGLNEQQSNGIELGAGGGRLIAGALKAAARATNPRPSRSDPIRTRALRKGRLWARPGGELWRAWRRLRWRA